MEATHVIKKPLLTEKTTYAMNEAGRYTFLVDRRASKVDVKDAVEEIYKVRVDAVSTQVRKGKARRLRHGWTKEGVTKKATVKLRPGDTIELF